MTKLSPVRVLLDAVDAMRGDIEMGHKPWRQAHHDAAWPDNTAEDYENVLDEVEAKLRGEESGMDTSFVGLLAELCEENEQITLRLTSGRHVTLHVPEFKGDYVSGNVMLGNTIDEAPSAFAVAHIQSVKG